MFAADDEVLAETWVAPVADVLRFLLHADGRGPVSYGRL